MQVRAPAPTPSRVGAAAVALAALALVLAAPAAADPLSVGGGASLRPRTVEAVQQKLADLGFLARSGVDGVFGAQSRGAVIAFQKWEGLVRDGIPGPVTQKALAAAKRPTPLTRGRGTRVEILLDRQLLLLVRRGRVARVVHASTGKRGFATPAGEVRRLSQAPALVLDPVQGLAAVRELLRRGHRHPPGDAASRSGPPRTAACA